MSAAAAAARGTGARLRRGRSRAGSTRRCIGRRRCSTPRPRGSTRCRRRGRWHAMPIALKDNIVTAEQPTTCASRILEGYVSPYDATAVAGSARRAR